MSSTIIKCHCKHDYQDQRYGAGMRVANHTAKAEARCTVCGTKQMVKDAPLVKKTGSGGSGGAKVFIALPPPEGWPGGHHEKNGWRPL